MLQNDYQCARCRNTLIAVMVAVGVQCVCMVIALSVFRYELLVLTQYWATWKLVRSPRQQRQQQKRHLRGVVNLSKVNIKCTILHLNPIPDVRYLSGEEEVAHY
jgi:hypothetical protein